MKTLLWCKKTLTNACVIYTFLVTSVYLLGAMVDSHLVPNLTMILSLLFFSVALSATNSFLFSDILILPFRLAIHYIATTFVFYIAFVVWGGYKDNGGSVITILLVYTFVYIILALIVGLLRRRTAESFNSKNHYKSIFGGERK